MAEIDPFEDDEQRRRVTVPPYQAPGGDTYTGAQNNPNASGNNGGFTGGGLNVAGAAPAANIPTADEIRRRLQASAGGIAVTDQDVADVQRLNQGDTIESRLGEFAAQYNRRNATTSHRPFDSQSTNPLAQTANRTSDQAAGRTVLPSWYGAGGGVSGGPTIPNTNQFTDPITGPVSDFANFLANRYSNPPSNSGNALLENALRMLSDQFSGGGFTNAENEVLQTQAIDPLERLRQARKQQIAQQLSARGVRVNLAAPEGIAKTAFDDVDRQFDQMRAQQQTALGARAAQERTTRQMQAIQLLSALAGNENTRFNQAFNYTSVPVGLADRSFNQGMQLYQQANPMNLFNPAMQLANMGQGQQASQGAALADILWAVLNSR